MPIAVDLISTSYLPKYKQAKYDNGNKELDS